MRESLIRRPILARAALAVVLPGAVLALPAMLLAAGERGTAERAPKTGLVREAGAFIETVSGTESVEPNGRLVLTAIGSVTVKGGDEGLVRYTLVKRVRAATEERARKLLGQYVLRASREGETTSLKLTHAGENGQSAEMILIVPRTLRSVEVQTHSGAVEASDLDSSFTATTGGGRMAIERIRGSLTARTAGGEIALDQIGGPIRCTTAGGEIRAGVLEKEAVLETAGGDIVVAEARGPLRVATAGGGVRVRKAGATVVAGTSGGAIEIGSVVGAVSAKTLGGPIRIERADEVAIESGGGAIRLDEVAGTLRATTAVGDILASLSGAGTRLESLLTTGGGDIIVYVPTRLPITIRAESLHSESPRRIVSEFPGLVPRIEGARAVAEGKIAGGGPLLRLASSSGTIYIRQQPPAGTARPRESSK